MLDVADRTVIEHPRSRFGLTLPGMQPRRHRMRQQQRRGSARGWIASGAVVTIKTYTRRYGVDRYTAYDDLTALGVRLPSSAQHRSQRPSPPPRPRRRAASDTSPLDTDSIILDGKPFFVAGYTSAGFPYGIFEDEMHDPPDDLGDALFPPDCDVFGADLDAEGPITRRHRDNPPQR
jgi:hypothetical protein